MKLRKSADWKQKIWNRNTKSKTESTVTGTKSLTRNWKRANCRRANRLGNHSQQQNRKWLQSEKLFQVNSANESNCKETELVRIWSYENGGKPWTLCNDNRSNSIQQYLQWSNKAGVFTEFLLTYDLKALNRSESILLSLTGWKKYETHALSPKAGSSKGKPFEPKPRQKQNLIKSSFEKNSPQQSVKNQATKTIQSPIWLQ